MKNRSVDFQRVLALAGLISLALIYLVLWLRMIGDPRERTGADFIAFYAAGRIAQTDGAARVYDVGLQQRVQADQVGFALAPGQVLLYNHLPYLIPLLGIIVSDSYAASFGRWALVLIALNLAAVAILSRLLARGGYERSPVLLAAAGGLLFFPAFVSVLNGQDTAFLFLSAAAWMFGLLTGQDALAGIGLSLTTVRPHIAVALALPFLFRRRKVFGWFAIGAGILGLSSVLILGVDGTKAFINLLLVSAGGQWYGLKEPEMFNLIGLLFRMAPGLGAQTIRAIGWGVYFLAIIALCMLWLRSSELNERHIGLAVIVTLFAVPHLHFHDLTLLLLPIYALLRASVRAERPGPPGRNGRRADGWIDPQRAALLPLAASITLVVSNFTPLLKYTVPYLMMLAFALALWFPDKLKALLGRST